MVRKKLGVAKLFSYPRAESNRNRQNRNLKFYPLNYGGRECDCKDIVFLLDFRYICQLI